MSHTQNSAVVILVVAGKLAFDLISRSAGAIAFRAAALDYEVWYYAMEFKSVIKPFFCQFAEIVNGVGSIFLIELHFHDSFVGVNSCSTHLNIYRLQVIVNS